MIWVYLIQLVRLKDTIIIFNIDKLTCPQMQRSKFTEKERSPYSTGL